MDELKKFQSFLIVVAMAILPWLLTCLLACGILRVITRTANDVAREYCEEYVEMKGYGISAKEWCAIQENLQPFIDLLTTTDQKIKADNKK